MNKDQQHTDPLETLFRHLPEEELPASFSMNVMEQIIKESVRLRKRNERLGLLAIILASLAMIALAVISCIYIGLPKIEMPGIDHSSLAFYLYIGLLSLFLLFLDYKLRRVFHKDE